MAKLTLSAAARACGVARTTLQRAVRAGRLSLDAEHQVDTSELLRAGYQVDAAALHAAMQQTPAVTPQNAAPLRSSAPQPGAVQQEIHLLRRENEMLQQERDRLVQQMEMLLTLHHTTQQHLTQAQQMLHEVQHRYDRLLEAPKLSTPAEVPRPSRPNAISGQSIPQPPGAVHPVTKGAAIPPAWQQIIDYVHSVNRAVTPVEVQQALRLDHTPRHMLNRMVQRGIFQRLEPGVYGLKG
jgi:hypothetical protein